MKIVIKITVLVTHKGKILLIKEYFEKRKSYFWNIIKGTYGDVDGESLLEAAIREAKEEAGVDIKVAGFFDILQVMKGKNKTKIQINFLGDAKNQKIKLADKSEQNKRSEDINMVQWIKPEEVEKMPKELIADPHILKLVDKLKNKNFHAVAEVINLRE